MTEEIRHQAATVRRIVIDHPQYISLLTSRNIDKQEKEKLLSDAFSGRVHPYLLYFMMLLNDRGYISQLSSCLYRYEERYLKAHGIVKCRVYSARALSDPEKDRISKSIEARTGKKTEIKWLIDSSLVAGIRAEADGLLFENSAKSRLEDLRSHLKTVVI